MRKRWIWIVALVLAAIVVGWLRFPVIALWLAERAELRAAGLRRASVEVAGHHVAYLVGGSGEPLVLLHGFGADKSNWVRTAKFLTPHFQVVAPDLPGFGESTRDPNARYGIFDQVERVHAIVGSLGLGQVHIAGNSMGGEIAGAYAARFPAEVKSLWLIAPGGVKSAARSELLKRLDAGENPLLVNDADGFERMMDFVFVERPAVPRPIMRYLAEQAIANRPFNEKVFRDLVAEPLALEDLLRDLPTPTLITWGDHDRLVDVSGAELLHAVMPSSEMVVLKNVGHVPMIEKPEETANGFLDFRHAR